MSGIQNPPIYKDKQVEVTQTTLRIKGKSYSIAGIGSVEMKRPNRWPPIIFTVIAALVAIATAQPPSHSTVTIVSAVVAMLFFFAIFAQPHRLFLRTASGELQAMESKASQVRAVKEAVEAAFAQRG